MIGKVIDGTYEVLELLGEGSFGIVYRCLERPLDRTVALKMLSRNAAGEREVKRFISEGRNLATLNHPNVVQIYRLGEFEGNPYIVMEYLSGKTLRSLIRGQPMGLTTCLKVMRQVASGLGAIHAMGIVHRDISPNNIVVTESGAAKILDLGLSKDMNDLSTMSGQGYLVGTLAYVAPEQVEGRPWSFSSEIFSFGVLLYEALTGVNPFRAEHHMSLLYNIAHRDPEPLDAHAVGYPADLGRVVMRCLEKRPENRPASMAEIEKTLALIGDIPDLDSTVTLRSMSTSGIGRTSLRNPYLNRVMIKRREDFFGRAQETKRVYARLNATPPGSISIVGERKIGKSSLLNHIYSHQSRLIHLEQTDRTVMVFLDLQAERNMSMKSFVQALLGIANYELRGRLDVSDCTHDLDGIRELVQRIDSAGYRLAILLDEFEGVTTNSNFDLEFFSFLRFLANHYNVAYVTSSARDLQVLCHTKEIADSPFFNIFSTMRLSVFQRQEAEELIRVPSEKAGQPLDRYCDRILEMSGLFPFYIQMACCHALEYLHENPDRDSPDFDEIRQRFYDEAKIHYRYIWDGFDDHQRSTALRVAAGKSIPDALEHVLKELESKHYVESDRGRFRLFATTFNDFVVTEFKARKRSFFDRLLGRRPG